MKIFNWVTKKLQPGTDYRRVARESGSDVFGEKGNGKSGPNLVVCEEVDTESLLLHQVLDHILTIGTLGHSHPLLLPSSLRQQEPSAELEDEHNEEKNLKSTTKIITTAKMTPPATLQLSKLESPIKEQVVSHTYVVEEVALEEESTESPLLKEDRESREKGRTTLADLFAAEPASKTDVSADKTKTSPLKSALSDKPKTTKKLKALKKGEESKRAATGSDTPKKLHKLITRMLKKKIHPDLARMEEELLYSKGGSSCAKVDGEGPALCLGQSAAGGTVSSGVTG